MELLPTASVATVELCARGLDANARDAHIQYLRRASVDRGGCFILIYFDLFYYPHKLVTALYALQPVLATR